MPRRMDSYLTIGLQFWGNVSVGSVKLTVKTAFANGFSTN